MKKIKIVTCLGLLVIMAYSCQKGSDASGAYEEAAAETNAESYESDVPMSSTAATYTNDKKKFARTANVAFESKNVYASTKSIEQTVSLMGGYVLLSNIEQQVVRTKEVAQSRDSMLLVRAVEDVNHMSVKVPQAELANFLNSLEPHISFLSRRHISAEDVTINYEQNQQQEKRTGGNVNKIEDALTQKGGVEEKTNAIDKLDHIQAKRDQSIINAKMLNEKISMSEVHIDITGYPKVISTIVPNAKQSYRESQPSFWHRAVVSLKSGWYYLKEALLIALNFIPFILLIAFIVGLYKYARKSFRKKE